VADDTPPDEAADAPADAEATEADAPAAEATAPEPEPEPAPEPNPVHEQMLADLKAGLGDDAVIESADAFGDLVVRITPASWQAAAKVAKDALECDYLSFISGIDWQPAPREGGEDSTDTSAPVQPTEMTFGAAGSAGRFQVFAHVQSTKKHWGLTFKTDVADADPRLATWVDEYPGADWHERECWEMYGVVFDGHPALRHLYLPSEFEGHPLRKDFPLLAREVKPWPGLVDVEPMPGGDAEAEPAAGDTADSAAGAEA